MHTLLLVAVETDSEEEACTHIEQFLDLHNMGDWWVIGGRWNGYFDGLNSLCAGDNPTRFLTAVDSMLHVRLQRLNELRQHFSGPDELIELHDPFGFTSAPDPKVVARQHAWFKDTADRFRDLLHRRDLPDESHWSVAMYLHQFATMIGDRPHVDAGVVDAHNDSCFVTDVRTRVETNPFHQWLTAVDIHT